MRAKLATYAAGACSLAERAPTPPEEMPREANRQSSSESSEPTRRPSARRMSLSAALEACALSVRRDSTTRVQDLGPPGARP